MKPNLRRSLYGQYAVRYCSARKLDERSVVGATLACFIFGLLCIQPSAGQTNHCAPPAIVGWWPLDGDGADLIAGLSGSLIGTPAFVPGKVGFAMRFDGVDDY